jgi:hypothetical protein
MIFVSAKRGGGVYACLRYLAFKKALHKPRVERYGEIPMLRKNMTLHKLHEGMPNVHGLTLQYALPMTQNKLPLQTRVEFNLGVEVPVSRIFPLFLDDRKVRRQISFHFSRGK